MSKTKISEFSQTASQNTDINSININEGCPPSTINNAIRELMKQIKDFQVGAQGDGLTVSTFHVSGSATAPTASPGTNTTQIATTEFVTAAVAGGTGSLGTMSTQNANNVAITGGSITGITDLAVADGGTGRSTLTTNNVLIGNGTSAVNFVAPGSSGNVLTSNGTTWASATPSAPSALSTASGSAPSYSARAWVNFNGGNAFSPNPSTSAIRGSGNVSSIAKNGTGDFTVNFSTAMPDIHYTVTEGHSQNAAGQNIDACFVFANPSTSETPTTGFFRVWYTQVGTGSRDPEYCTLSVFR
jgi:hypothetical protein